MGKVKNIGGTLGLGEKKIPVRFEISISVSTVAEIKNHNPHLTDEQAKRVLDIVNEVIEMEKDNERYPTKAN